MGNLRKKFLHDRRGYSMTFWAVFIGLVLIPALAFAIELGRYFYAISEVQKAADAAAVAAAAEINQRVFQDTGSLISTSKTWANAQSYVSSNTIGLSAKGVHAFVTGIQVSGGDNTVRVNVSANLSILFPSVVPNVTVTQTGIAKLRAFTH
jgi:Flp pilus assembly protein TadG